MDRGVHLVQHDTANTHLIEFDDTDLGLAIGRLRHTLPALARIQPQPARIACPQGNHAGPGIHQKAYGISIYRTGRHEMPLPIGGQNHLARTI